MRTHKKDGYKEAGHDRDFKPAKQVQRKVKADFEHMQDYTEVKKNFKGPDGVITEPRNFLTNPPKVGLVGKNTTFAGNLEHMADPFDHRKELEKKEREDHLSKLQEKPFSNKVKPRETFAAVKEVFGEDREYPARKEAEKRKPLMEHDAPFKPSNPPKRGYNKTLDKFPEYKEDPLKEVVRKKGADDDKAKWKPTYNKRSKPTPSVTTNYKNLKSEFPSVFRKL